MEQSRIVDILDWLSSLSRRDGNLEAVSVGIDRETFRPALKVIFAGVEEKHGAHALALGFCNSLFQAPSSSDLSTAQATQFLSVMRSAGGSGVGAASKSAKFV